MKTIHLGCACLAGFMALTLTMTAAEPSPGRQVEQTLLLPDGGKVPYVIYLPEDYQAGEAKWPLMLFLHGRGESYGPLSLVKKWGPPRWVELGQAFPFILVSPQCPGEDRWSSEKQQAGLVALLEHLAKNHSVDPDRVYLTGLSMGGYGSWRLAADHPERFAAVVPVCGGGDPADAGRLKDLPIWVFHGDQDKAVPMQRSVEMVEAIRKAGGTKVKFTTLEGIGHNSWSAAYATPELYQWLGGSGLPGMDWRRPRNPEGNALTHPMLNRRKFMGRLGGASAVAAWAASRAFLAAAEPASPFRYLVGSCMYGKLPLAEILPEVKRTGAGHIDLWPRVHGNQREQVDRMGLDAFRTLLREHGVEVGCISRYDLGPFKLDTELEVAGKLQCPVIVTGGKGPVGLKGVELKKAVRGFVEKLKPAMDKAAARGVTLAIENHGRNLIDTPDSLRWLAELSADRPGQLGVALAPYHLENLGLNASDLAGLMRDLGHRMAVFYAWQYGMGCHKKWPKAKELLQMPGRGPLDFTLLVEALRDIRFRGFTEIFMHPVPRGIPILPTASAVSEEIIRAKEYLEACLHRA